MIITAKIRLFPNEEQKQELIQTLEAVKYGLNFASKIAYENNLLSNSMSLQKLIYDDLRSYYKLKAQMSCTVCRIVAGTYKSIKSNNENTLAIYKKPKLEYQYNKDYSFVSPKKSSTILVSIGTLNGRVKIPFTNKGFDKYFDGTWEYGASTLIYKKKKFYLHMSMEKEFLTLDTQNIQNIIGVDLGMRFIITATNSNGETLFFNGKQIINKRAKCLKQRKDLQEVGTKSAKRKLKKLSGQENSFVTNVNHNVAKALVNFAGKDSLIVLEDLTNINITTKVQHNFRYYRMSWAFAQLGFFIKYKAEQNGSKVISVNPAYTSQKCPKCGYIHKENRNHKIHLFTCKNCSYKSNDDRIASINLEQMGREAKLSAVI